MAKITYTSLKLKTETNVKTFNFNDKQIEVLQYLPIEDKYDLIINALESAEENNIYNPIKLDAYFHLYLVYMYTNLTFTEKNKENELKIYDCLQSTGFITALLNEIPDSEYETLRIYLEETMNLLLQDKRTIGFFLGNILDEMSKKIELLQGMVNNVDDVKYTNMIELAKALNGGRDI